MRDPYYIDPDFHQDDAERHFTWYVPLTKVYVPEGPEVKMVEDKPVS